jgi:methylmalonyl-CoA mutase N-terminal domain/subunit
MDIWEYCIKNMPKWYMVSISGYHIREAGATAIEELAFTIADGIAYVEAALERGLKVDDFGPRLSFFFGCHNNFLQEIAKFRAGRRIWARIMKERFKANDPKSLMLRFHTQTCGSTLTAQQPENNAIRVALQAFAAVLGGSQSLHTNSFDEALSLPSERAVTLALRTQQIIAYESGLTDVVDPLGGSYYLEKLTNEIESGVLELLKTIDSQGGAVSSIENGFVQRKIEDSAYRYQKEVEQTKRKIVGVNAFTEPEKEAEREILKVSHKLYEERKQRLEQFRNKQDKTKIKQALDSLASGAQKNENLMPYFIAAVELGATLEEMCNVLRQIWGEYDVKKS